MTRHQFSARRSPNALAGALQWSEVVTGPARIITQRPKEDLWSPLEYACHIADVFDIMHYRIGLLLAHDNPEFPNWDQDQTAIENDYATHDPLDVGKRLADRGNRLADLMRARSRNAVGPIGPKR